MNEQDGEVRTFDYIPTVQEYSEELVEALDPENGIEEEYMPYHNSVYNWRLLRLLLFQNSREFCKLSDKNPPISGIATFCALKEMNVPEGAELKDKSVEEIDKILANKEKEVMSV